MKIGKWNLRQLCRDQGGNVIAMVAVGMPVLIGCAGLAIDTTQWVLARRQLQATVDAAALAGVHALIQGTSAEEGVSDAVGRDPNLPADASVQAVQSPEGRSEDPYAVAVTISIPARTSFATMFLRKPFAITAQATATVVETGEFCAFAIGSTDLPGLVVEPGSQVEMDCGLATNSQSPEAIKADPSAKVTADRITAFGGSTGDSALQDSRVRTYGLKQKDPFANTEPPVIPSTGCPNVTVNAGGSGGRGQVSLKPACYGNMVINGTARLEPGDYILNRGNLLVGETGNLSCNGCTIFLTSQDAAVDPGSVGKVRIHERATVKLSAPKHGPSEGILIYQDRRAGSDIAGLENRIGGSSFSKFEGLIYFPSDTVRIDARNAPDLECARLIGKRLIIDGRLLIAKGCNASGKMNFAGSEVRLIG